MINKKPSSRINLSNYILILPLIMLLVLCVGTSKDALSGTNIVSNVKEHLLDSGGASEALNPSKFEGGSKKPINNVSNIDNLNKLVFETLNTIKHVALADTDKSGIQIKQIKEREPDIKHLTIRVNGQDTIKDLIYLIDGIRVITPIKRLEPSSIASINVIKGIEATKLYGAEAANGVISITTKSLAETKNNIRNIPPDTSDSNAGEKISLNNVDADIFILDGKEVSKETIDEMQVSTIGSIEVLKGAAAIAKYGEKVKKGVVIVTSKK